MARVAEVNGFFPRDLLLGIEYETTLLRSYLESQNVPVATFCTSVLLPRLAEVSCIAGVRPDSVMCAACLCLVYGELAYKYRTEIAGPIGPARPDCHWGHNCRTASHNASHAQRFNHVCDQTRQG